MCCSKAAVTNRAAKGGQHAQFRICHGAMAGAADAAKQELDAMFASDDEDDDVVGATNTAATAEASATAAVDTLFGDSDVEDSEDDAPKVRLKLKARGKKVCGWCSVWRVAVWTHPMLPAGPQGRAQAPS